VGSPDYAQVRNYQVSEGEFINEEHMLGQALRRPDRAGGRQRPVWSYEALVGETVRIEGQPFRIIRVLNRAVDRDFPAKTMSSWFPTTAQTRLIRRSTRDQVDLLMVQAASSQEVPQASFEVAEILRNRHQTEIGEDDFTILTQQDFLETASTITNVLTIFLGGIAAISLLVGGIGIMNIMLVSVTERTREIGLRKAVGAHKADIMIQFLTESSVLSLLGGLIGIALGWIISVIVGRIAQASNAPINPYIGADIVLLATLFSTAVGLFFDCTQRIVPPTWSRGSTALQ
jgi:putative ABC transport system permease protein